MITRSESPDRTSLERIADGYRRRGFEVIVQPRGADLPSFLADSSPDLIARRGAENLLIEVEDSAKDVDPAHVDSIAQRVAAQPGWRFVIMAPAPTRTLKGADLTTLDEDAILARLDESNDLLRSGHLEAALMVAWAATEGIIRLLIARHRLAIQRDDAPTLIRSLVSEGYVDEDEFRALNEAYQFRSEIAHGRRPPRDESAREAARVAEVLAAISRALLEELPASA